MNQEHLKNTIYFSALTKLSPMKNFIAWIAFVVSQLSYTATSSQIAVNNNVLIDNVIAELLGPEVIYSNVTFSGSSNQIGTFLNSNTGVMGLGAGVILGTGDVLNAIGPNNASSASLGGGNSGASDPDLDAMDGLVHNDAAILEFDFVATGTTMNFQYVFASEEYPEYTGAGGCGNVSDVFGFFLSGPGIAGTFSNNAINVALIPGSNQFVSIANLNAGCDGLAVPGDEFCNYCEYYINNGDGFTDPFMSDPAYLQYDGYTSVLTASYNGLQCGQTYHIKLALADVSDTAFDSAVFLKSSGFGVSNDFIEPSLSNINQNGSLTAAEGCLDATFFFNVPSCEFSNNTLYFSYSGTAQNGIDYELLPSELAIDPLYNSLTIYPINDGIDEGTETVEIIASFFDAFGNYYADTIYYEILDYIDFNGNGLCDNLETFCIDYYACNYNPFASVNQSDASCTYPGCTDVNADNYDFTAGCDDGSCTYYQNPLYIPDNQGCFYMSDYINVPGMPYVQDTYDVAQISLTIEHSYVGDLIINVICPNGQVMNILPAEAGSGTYLGEPIDVDDGVPGVGYTYTFSPGSFGSSWMAYLNAGGASTIPAGDYLPEGSFADFIGCPINGEWQLEICDVVGSDDGWVFDFSVSISSVGCTDWAACNYDAFAYYDDGSCTYPGCTDPFAANYNYYAGCDDGSCFYGDIYGCTDYYACNYDASANEDDGSCTYPGCTDPAAVNYDYNAGCEDGSCYYDYIFGCTDNYACNYDASANVDDGSCTYPGCTDPAAVNYDGFAGCSDFSCVYSVFCGNPQLFFESGACVASDNGVGVEVVVTFAFEGECTVATVTLNGQEFDVSGEFFTAYTQIPIVFDPFSSTVWSYTLGNGVSSENYTYSVSGCPEYYGCTDISACNFQDLATIDDGSCTYPGCADPSALNYDALAGCYDNSCYYSYDYGCMDMLACNYNPYAIYNDFCTYPGCTNVEAYNYNFDAGCDDGSCLYTGCTDVNACNYIDYANLDLGNCSYPGCNDPTAVNYNPAAGCSDFSCYYAGGCSNPTLIIDEGPCTSSGDTYGPELLLTFAFDGTCTVSSITVNGQEFDVSANNYTAYSQETVVLPSNFTSQWYYTLGNGLTSPIYNFTTSNCAAVFGCTDVFACNYDVASNFDDGSCTYPGCTDPNAINFDYDAGCDDGSCYYDMIYGCTDFNACNYYELATINDGSCTYPGCTDPNAINFDYYAGCDDGSCYYDYLYGCTDISACNYDETANYDDGSCTYPGCTVWEACNYSPYAGCDDGSCYYLAGCIDYNACNYMPEACQNDGSCTYPGCSDPVACNYYENAGCDDGSCAYTYGCTNYSACNYTPGACSDNGSCVFPGCLDSNACNYDPYAGCDFGQCSYEFGCTDFNACNYDVYACFEDGSCTYGWGCTDFYACNYDMNASCDNGDCLYPGCTEFSACNYNPLAGCDDGSCYFADQGCTDSYACNYDPNAGCDNGSCLYPGCTEFEACNYNPMAGCSDNSCEFNAGCTDYYACNYDPLAYCSDGTCEYAGCTDPSACNYYSNAACDDGSCSFISGCVDYNACNFDADAGCDDGSCVYPGCMDTAACNYDYYAGCSNGSCEYIGGCTESNACNYDPYAGCNDGSCVYPGCTDPLACNYNANAGCNDGYCNYISGCTDWFACNFDPYAYCNDGTCTYPGCMDSSACNFDVTAQCDNGSCEYVAGCTYFGACNFNPYAGCDDGSCEYSGCMDSLACNYDATASCDNGSCSITLGCMDFYACNFNPAAGCDDGSCNYPGCTDVAACNYSNSAACDDGSCEYIYGCMDYYACNFDENAGCDDGSCQYPGFSCDDDNAQTNNDFINLECQCMGIPNGLVAGCMNPDACNYNPAATFDDLSCLIIGQSCNDLISGTSYDVVTENCVCQGVILGDTITGCTIPSACNYSPASNYNDGSCLIIGESCNDGNSETQNDMITADCFCEGLVGIEEYSNNFGIYPNPANMQLNISYSGAMPQKLEVFSVIGEQIVFSSWKSQLDVSNLPNGMYILRIWRDGFAETRRFEVQH